MFFLGIFLSVKTLIKQIRGEHEKRFFAIRSGPVFVIYLFHTLHWSLLMFSLLSPDALPLIKFVIFSIASDIFFTALFSSLILKRRLTSSHLLSFILSLIAIFFSSFLTVKQTTYELDFTFTTHKLYPLIYLILSRMSLSITQIAYKRALLNESAIQRYRAFKLSPFRRLKLFDFEPKSDQVGELIKPTASEASRVFNKAKYIINLRKLVADEMGKKDQLLMEYEPEKIIKQMAGLIEELERIEKIKVTR